MSEFKYTGGWLEIVYQKAYSEIVCTNRYKNEKVIYGRQVVPRSRDKAQDHSGRS
jgi:hypothetical protein